MTCADRLVELVECARRHAEPGRDLQEHLDICSPCRERWEAENLLTHQFRLMRVQAAALMTPDVQRDAVMNDFSAFDFARRSAVRERHRAAIRSWSGALAAAAVVLLAVFAGHSVATRLRHAPAASHKTAAPVYEARVNSYDSSALESSADASALSSDDFTAVPYTPPLAQGELVRVVHADLDPEALASLGIDVDPVWAGPGTESTVSADVVVGEDGIPRAVRITETAQ